MSRAYRVLDGVGVGVSADAALPNRVTCVYVLSGAARIEHIGHTVVSLVPGDRQVLDGLPAGQIMTWISEADNTVGEWVG